MENEEDHIRVPVEHLYLGVLVMGKRATLVGITTRRRKGHVFVITIWVTSRLLVQGEQER